MKDTPKNLPASVRQRLQNLARARHEDLQLVLGRYGLERLVYRLSRSPHRDLFVLKGAMLFHFWTDQPHRPTRDLDFLAFGDHSIHRMEEVFRDVCLQEVTGDGLVFVADSVTGEVIKPDQEYEGLRVKLGARLERARIPIQIDIGFGDAVTPGPQRVGYPSMLGFPTSAIAIYPKETVIAEKLQAMVMLGMANSRMKDFYDLWVLARQFEFDCHLLSRAIRATFECRKTAIPKGQPLALTDEFCQDQTKQVQWKAFLGKGKLLALPLEEVASALRGFLFLPMEAAREGTSLDRQWKPPGPWQH